ncbi:MULTISPECIES: ArsR/SmtB family transcription factor [unclassified Candidatus Frackibacter]|uniref:ArsR/SmtB family transcription factor n=1 Tax=unclassified Candidatus Frackibacter TaxID=2648818 RepID=UPI00079A9C1E|nr:MULTISPECIES: metalloregulator ArsR/SmtB family transcription factor [unclassified Candidatus Frackibacter]KXS41050.1 MAG: ArsR family transcriptional regulator [Candidatus Frackibacter sp. T328-2]SDC79418.1 transcriptional regulator, ArsR family [Candidatus Frackibacter sp. WG11]SEM92082.1 transcriptional regulator, ArsR family [Candidatus Frackibacter sp. WG12]SFM01842.1 transcriptional regulator, ArsR family [Candidatus Frackibacter sp. WG13]
MKDFDVDMELLKGKAKILKALAHPVRLCIVKGLLKVGSCNVSNMQSCLEVPQSTVSQHLAKLRNAGIITGKRNGVEINYSVINEDAKAIVETLFS